jgi:hypothetical protein
MDDDSTPGFRHQAGKHELGSSLVGPVAYLTDWMVHVQGMLYRILRNQEGQMATLSDVQTAITNLKDETESGIQTLIDKINSGGTVSGDDLQGLVDQLNGLHDEVVNTVGSVTSPSTPPSPTPPAPATPGA